MLKRVLTLCLALVFCLSLSCAALADAPRDTDPPQWQQWGFDSLEEYLQYFDETEEEYYDEIALDVAMELEYPAWKADYLAAHPGYVAQLLAEDAEDPLWEFFGYKSQAELEKAYGQSYADYLADRELKWKFRDQWYEAELLRQRVEMGGPAEGVGVMWMGEYVQFPDAQPAMVKNRTMVPVRALMECAGATVDYQDDTVLLKTGDAEISFRPGETDVTLVKDGETSTLQMDVAPYISQRRTYVPLRFFSEALGYDVLWDPDYKTAVILDPVAVIDRLNRDFQTVNSLFTAQTLPTAQVRQCDATFNGKLTVFDSINGNKTADLTGSASVLFSDKAIDAHYDYDMGQVLDLLMTLIPAAAEMSPEDLAELAMLRRMEMDMIYDLAENKGYMHFPALTANLPDVPADAWLMTPGADMGQTVQLLPHGLSIGALLYASELEYGGVNSYADMLEAADELAQVFGDARFTAVAGGKELNMDLNTLGADLAEELGREGLKACSLKLRVNADGSAVLNVDVSLDGGLFGATCALEMYTSARGTSMKLSCHVRNLMELTITGESTMRDSTKSPRTAPPAGATIISE